MGFEEVVKRLSSNVPAPKESYTGHGGLLYCKACNTCIEKDIDVYGKKMRVRCICKCGKQEIDSKVEREKKEERERRRSVCFSESNMKDWCFENDDRSEPKISDAMKRYSDNFPDFLQQGKGLLLYGSVGTGKTYYSACIANQLIDNGYKVLMTNFARLTNKLQGTFDGKNNVIDSLSQYSLLIIDDLGAERRSDYMQEMVFNIIDSRYRSGKPLIITTNLSAKDLANNRELGYSRIYDRILERCFPVEITGKSRRRKNLLDDFETTKNLLGL